MTLFLIFGLGAETPPVTAQIQIHIRIVRRLPNRTQGRRSRGMDKHTKQTHMRATIPLTTPWHQYVEVCETIPVSRSTIQTAECVGIETAHIAPRAVPIQPSVPALSVGGGWRADFLTASTGERGKGQYLAARAVLSRTGGTGRYKWTCGRPRGRQTQKRGVLPPLGQIILRI